MAMQPVNEQLLEEVDAYIENLFVPRDATLEQNLKDAAEAGLPSINVSPNQGRLLYVIAKMTGARRVLEIGTLGGYSTTWLARALPEGGTVTTLELKAETAAIARKNLERAGAVGRVNIRIGRASETLDKMITAGEGPFDLIFIDADKTGYMGYLDQVLKLSRAGTVILADNLIRHGAVLVETPSDENATAVKQFNAAVAAHPRLESILLPILRGKIDGLSISVVK
jgi:predicted O-methyltransferase YrrM